MQADNKLVTELVLDGGKFKSELANAKASVSSFVNHAKSIGIGITAAFAAGAAAAASLSAALANQAEKIEAVAKNAERLGISTSSFQSLAYAAHIADTSMDSVSAAISRLQKNVYAAQHGNTEAAKSFRDLGLDVEKFKGMTPDQIFLEVKNAIAGTTNETDRLAKAQTVMGRGAMSVMNLLKADIVGLQAEYSSLGIALSDSQEKAVGSANDSKKTLGALWEGLANQITADVAPAFDSVVKSIVDVVKETNGIKPVAASMAESLVSGVIIVIEAYDGFLSLLDKIFDMLTNIGALSYNVFQRLNVAGNTIHEFARFNPDAATDPRVVGTVDPLKFNDVNHDNPVRTSEALVARLKTLKGDLNGQANGGGVLDSFIPPIGKFTAALDQATASLSSLKDLFGIDGKDGEGYIKSRLSASATGQATDPEFDSLLQEIKEDIQNGNSKGIGSKINDLKSVRDFAELSHSSDNIDKLSSGKDATSLSFSSMDAAIKAIQEKLGDKKAQEVTVNIKVDEQGMIKAFSGSTAATDVINQRISEKTSSERRFARS